MRLKSFLLLLTIFTLIVGCSHDSKLVFDGFPTPENEIINSDIPLATTSDSLSSIGLLGAYELSISPEEQSAELTSIRDMAAIGDAFTVNGGAFFTLTPCANCLKIKSIALDDNENIVIGFKVKHPFPKGNINLPPSNINRLDLDVFDLALMVSPLGIFPSLYPLTSALVQDEYLLNADGYSTELQDLTFYPSALPYKICFESPNNNRFEMGSDWKNFEIVLPAKQMIFNLFLTMGYGASATKNTRLSPVYYVPEFNRKAAWKVVITPPQGQFPPTIGNTWNAANKTTAYPVTIDIYDWNHGATISPAYPDPLHTNYIRASSNIASVSAEVPSMTDSLIIATTSDTSTNGWDDPLTYTASFANENALGVGEYLGLVKVMDSRAPGAIAGGPDSLIDSPNGSDLDGYALHEFATYQSFTAIIVMGPPPDYEHGDGIPGKGIRDNGNGFDVDSSGNVYITGSFEGTDVDFDPGPATDLHSSNGGLDIYFTKFDPNGNYIFTKTLGASGIWDEGFGLSISLTNVYITGRFENTVDFDPGPGTVNRTSNGGGDAFLCKFDTDGNFQWVVTFGASGIWDEGFGLGISISGNINIMGHFSNTVDFDPGVGTDWHTSNGDDDIFLSCFDSNGNFQWARTWGGQLEDGVHGMAIDHAGRILITGYYMMSVDFDPGAGTDLHSSKGFKDIFFSRFSSNGNFEFARTWGGFMGLIYEDGCAIAADSTDNIFVTGRFEGSVDFDPGSGTESVTSLGGADTFLSKFDSTGNFQWVRTWGDTGNLDEGNGILVDDFDFIYVIGNFEGTVDFNPGPAVTEFTSNGGQDVYVSKFNNNGNYVLTIVWGGADFWDEGHGMAIDDSGNIYTKGSFSGTVDMDPSGGTDLKTSTGDPDVFYTKFSYN